MADTRPAAEFALQARRLPRRTCAQFATITRALIASVCLLATCAGTAAAAVTPLPESNYAIAPVCSTPASGHAGCLALALEPRTAAARAKRHPIGIDTSAPVVAGRASEGADGLRPIDLEHAYFPGSGERPDAPEGRPQTIALVDAYNDYEASNDLAAYSAEFGLPSLPNCATRAERDCFEQVGGQGEGGALLPFPQSASALASREATCLSATAPPREREAACAEVTEAESWSVEISTDIEVAHAICQDCKILLVEAGSTSYAALDEAENTAVSLGAQEVSNSWGGGEPSSSEPRARLALEADAVAFRHPGTVITASAGDAGYLNWTGTEQAGYTDTADFPASSPDVVAVGGTKLEISGGVRAGESVWNQVSDPTRDGAAGGGCSNVFEAPVWQSSVPDWSSVGCGSKRAVADVAADADPYTGVAVYDSMPDLREERGVTRNSPLGWLPVGGTSVASPIVAAMFALAGGGNGVEYPARTLYSHLQTSLLYDVTQGGNGACDGQYASCSGSLLSTSPAYPLDCGHGALICNAAPGCGSEFYAGPTGVGSPNGIAGFEPGEAPLISRECTAAKEAPAGEASEAGARAPEGAAGEPSEEASPGATGSPAGGSSIAPPSKVLPAPAPVSSGGVSSTAGSSGATHGSRSRSKRRRARILALSIAHVSRPVRRSARKAGSSSGGPSIVFALRLSASARVAVRLTRRVHRGVRLMRRTRYLRERAGFSRHTLLIGAARPLPPGRYTLELELAGGGTRSISFELR